MKRAPRKSTRNRDVELAAVEQHRAEEEGPAPQKIDRRPIEAKTENQRLYLAAMRTAGITFGLGPAGTGKTFLAAAIAAEMLDGKEVERIIVARPAVEAGAKMGFLPGEIDEKFDPYLRPFKEVLERRLGKSKVQLHMKRLTIEARPLAYMRGATFDNAIVVLDEAQNTTPVEMKMFLTRIGDNSSIVVNGDLRQKDIPGPSGLEDAIKRLATLKEVSVVQFTKADVVRSGLCRAIVERYDD
jgi:phosphate starvation-inducible PhoH-like protein